MLPCDWQLILIHSELKRLQIKPPSSQEAVKTSTGLGLFDSLGAAFIHERSAPIPTFKVILVVLYSWNHSVREYIINTHQTHCVSLVLLVRNKSFLVLFILLYYNLLLYYCIYRIFKLFIFLFVFYLRTITTKQKSKRWF